MRRKEKQIEMYTSSRLQNEGKNLYVLCWYYVRKKEREKERDFAIIDLKSS